MVTLRIVFPAGRYHATRWGTHVNEADIDWPPSPWRLLRALLAVGYAKLGWSEPPTSDERELVETLSAVLPTYHLPHGVAAAHTRHYMPQYKGSTAKVFDNFLHVGRDEALYVSWPVDLTRGQLQLLDTLVERLTYLGRAESWVEVQRVDSAHGLLCTAEPTDGAEPVSLLAPVSPDAYEEWRKEQLDEQRAHALSAKVEAAKAKGKKLPTKLGKGDEKKIAALFPRTVTEVLSRDTGMLRAQRWSQPPGSREIIYWRPTDAIDGAPVPSRRPHRKAERPTLAVYEVSSDTEQGSVLPQLQTTLRRTDQLHGALVSFCDDAPAPAVTGRDDDGAPLTGHQHAHVLALPRPGYHPANVAKAGIHRFAVWAPRGFGHVEIDALLRLEHLYTKSAALTVRCAGLGDPAMLNGQEAAFGSGFVWESVTPFVCPRFEKSSGANTLEGQLRAELEQRGFDSPEEVLVEHKDAPTWSPPGSGQPAIRWRKFVLERGRHSPKVRRCYGVRLRFSQPQAGPIALGYGCHFGLGLFGLVA